jgi:hypothetical protein
MSYHFEFDSRNRILLAVAYGRVDDSEMQELCFGTRKRKDEDDALTGILDLSEVTDFDVRSETIRGLANMPPNFEDPTIRAAVTPTDFLFGIARMFQSRGAATRRQLHIVRTFNEALVLLGVESPQFQRSSAA